MTAILVDSRVAEELDTPLGSHPREHERGAAPAPPPRARASKRRQRTTPKKPRTEPTPPDARG
ncbi:hypothetical protein, partial [Nocardia cyriacigeorgica]|uniref:hypothetical protein n=1 Tax=Nocardia cyriacigeorgica TaxID=135487 RepID=UPI002456B669